MRHVELAAALVAALGPVAAARSDELRYVPRHEELKYTFGGAAPTHRIKPGTRIVSWSEDCFDGALSKPGQKPSAVLVPGHDKHRETPWPRIENAEWMMSLGAARPLEDAARIAFKDMARWVQEKSSLAEMDAYEFVSQNARAPVTQIADPEYTVLVKIPKARLPAPVR